MKYLDLLSHIPLFFGFDQSQISEILSMPEIVLKKFAEGEGIFFRGQPIDSLGILLSGSISITKLDIDGNQLLISKVKPGEVFGESFACAGGERATVNVIASENSEILFLHSKLFDVLPAEFSRNLRQVLAQKNLFLNRRIELLSLGSVREKVLSYLLEEADKQGKNPVYIPFNRNEMAEYLCIDRSALSRELSRLKKEEMIDYHKNCFKLIRSCKHD